MIVSLPDPETLFRWEILCDAAFEDHQGVWEPYWMLRGDTYAPTLSEPERQAHVEAALRDLWKSDCIRFFNVPSGSVNDAADDPACSIADADVPRLLSATWWREIPLPRADVWFTTTERGDRRAADVQAQLRTYVDRTGRQPAGLLPAAASSRRI